MNPEGISANTGMYCEVDSPRLTAFDSGTKKFSLTDPTKEFSQTIDATPLAARAITL